MERYLNDIFKHTNCIGVLITDGNGIIVQVEERFDDTYGIPNSNLVGKSVFELEKKGIFKPSVAAIVLATKKDATIVQEVADGHKVIVTAFPMFNDEHEIEKVITFTRGIDEYVEYRNRYEELNRKIELYNKNLSEIGYIDEDGSDEIITTSKDFQKILQNIAKIAKYDINVLIEGETGVGKSLLARRIHKMSNFSKGRYVEINCGALPDNLIESELFGYEKGAFSGADRNGKAGLIELAANGSLMLDEISELPLAAQVKLLQVIQERKFRRIGGTEDIEATCRFIAASNKSLEEEVAKGKFRQDLLYRLNTVSYVIPPLRERKDDIIPLCNKLLQQANKKYATNRMFSSVALKLMTEYSWPGNVREIENLINRLAIIADDSIITKGDLPSHIIEASASVTYKPVEEALEVALWDITDIKDAMEQYESVIINYFYKKEGSSVKLAKRLNMSQTNASRKINKYVKK